MTQFAYEVRLTKEKPSSLVRRRLEGVLPQGALLLLWLKSISGSLWPVQIASAPRSPLCMLPRIQSNMASIAGQVALITGASSGIGEAIAWKFAEAGTKLILIARRSERLNGLKTQLTEKFNVGQLLTCT